MTLNIKQRITNYPTLHKHREPREQRNIQKRHTWIHVGRNKGKNTLSKMEAGGQREERKGEGRKAEEWGNCSIMNKKWNKIKGNKAKEETEEQLF